jgi:DNA-directed RNA polymerase beta' subunit
MRGNNQQAISYVETRKPYLLEFGVIDQEEILRSSVVEVRNERIYEPGLTWPTLEGVNDPRMGTIDRDRLCLTCQGS